MRPRRLTLVHPPLPVARHPCALLQEQELEAMKARLADMEKEAAKLKEMQVRDIWLTGGASIKSRKGDAGVIWVDRGGASH